MARHLPTLLVAGNLALPRDSKEVPVDHIVGWAKRRMAEFGASAPKTMGDRVLIVRARTGTGKSTALPVYVFRILRAERTPPRRPYRGKSVLCTQPRVLTAIALARDISAAPYYPDMELGRTVGYQTGPINEKPPSGLIYATLPTLLAQLRVMPDDEIMGLYRFIIIDEAHERSLEADDTLMKLKYFYQRNMGDPRLPILMLTSATINVRRYAQFFGVEEDNIVDVKGRSYGVRTIWPRHGTNNYLQAAAQTAVQIHEKGSDDRPEQADILVFMPGKGEIDAVKQALIKANQTYLRSESKIPPFLVLPIDSEAVSKQTRDYWLVFAPPETLEPLGESNRRPSRRVVISTKVAETGLTIDTLKYVIDCGWNREPETYPPYGVTGLLTRPAAKTRITQRKGRAGRLFPGEFHPLFTEHVYKALDDEQLPSVVTEGPANILLDMVIEQQQDKSRRGVHAEFRVEDIDMLDPPPADALAMSLEEALALGTLSDHAELPGGGHGYGLTELGLIAARTIYTPIVALRLVLAGYVWQVSIQDLATIAAVFEMRRKDFIDTTDHAARPHGALALRAGLPGFLVRRTGGGSKQADLPPSESEAFYYRARLLLADDHIEALIAFEGFVGATERLEGDISALGTWCQDNGVILEGMLDLVRQRDKILEDLIVAGLNPFWGQEHRLVASGGIEHFMATTIRIKHCLYEALRLRVLQYDEQQNTYRTAHGLPVAVPEAFTDVAASRLRGLGVREFSKPKSILTSSINLVLARPARRGPRRIIYELRAGHISVLDGYVHPDPHFVTLRSA